jgi:hypothetical protein
LLSKSLLLPLSHWSDEIPPRDALKRKARNALAANPGTRGFSAHHRPSTPTISQLNPSQALPALAYNSFRAVVVFLSEQTCAAACKNNRGRFGFRRANLAEQHVIMASSAGITERSSSATIQAFGMTFLWVKGPNKLFFEGKELGNDEILDFVKVGVLPAEATNFFSAAYPEAFKDYLLSQQQKKQQQSHSPKQAKAAAAAPVLAKPPAPSSSGAKQKPFAAKQEEDSDEEEDYEEPFVLAGGGSSKKAATKQQQKQQPAAKSGAGAAAALLTLSDDDDSDDEGDSEGGGGGASKSSSSSSAVSKASTALKKPAPGSSASSHGGGGKSEAVAASAPSSSSSQMTQAEVGKMDKLLEGNEYRIGAGSHIDWEKLSEIMGKPVKVLQEYYVPAWRKRQEDARLARTAERAKQKETIGLSKQQ